MIARQKELHELFMLSKQQARVIALTGQSGQGKTTLARSWEVHYGGEYVDLAGCVSTEDVLCWLAQHFDADAEHPIEASLKALGARWLILDHVGDVRLELERLLEFWSMQVPTLRVMWVSPARPEKVPHAWMQLGGLSEDQGVALIKSWVGQTMSLDDELAARALVEKVEGHPGALVWMARRLQVYDVTRWSQVLRDASAGISKSRIFSGSYFQSRQLDLVLEGLSDIARQLLEGLAVIHGTYAAPQLLEWTGVDGSHQGMMALQELLDVSCLQRECSPEGDILFKVTEYMRHLLVAPEACDSQAVRASWQVKTRSRLFTTLDRWCLLALDEGDKIPLQAYPDIWVMWRVVQHRPDKYGGHDGMRRWVARQLAQRGSYSTWFGMRASSARTSTVSREDTEQAVRRHLARGHVNAARLEVEQALERVEATDLTGVIALHGVLARLYRQSGQWESAAACFEKIATLCFEQGEQARGWRNLWRSITLLHSREAMPAHVHTMASGLLAALERGESGLRFDRSQVLLVCMESAVCCDPVAARRYDDALKRLEEMGELDSELQAAAWTARGDLEAYDSWQIAKSSYDRAAKLYDAMQKAIPERLWRHRVLVCVALEELDVLTLRALDETHDARSLLLNASLAVAHDDHELARSCIESARDLPEPLYHRAVYGALLAWAAHLEEGTPCQDSAPMSEDLDQDSRLLCEGIEAILSRRISHTSWHHPCEAFARGLLHTLEVLTRHVRATYRPHMAHKTHARVHEALVYFGDFEAYLTPDGVWGDLSNKPLLQSMLKVLCEHPDGASIEQLFEIVWPDEPATSPSSAKNRVRVMISRLRGQGLKPWLETVPGGYCLSISVCDARSIHAQSS